MYSIPLSSKIDFFIEMLNGKDKDCYSERKRDVHNMHLRCRTYAITDVLLSLPYTLMAYSGGRLRALEQWSERREIMYKAALGE